MKDLDVGETWQNYTRSYINASMGDMHRYQYTTWRSDYMSKESSQTDVVPEQHELISQSVDRMYLDDCAKYYI